MDDINLELLENLIEEKTKELSNTPTFLEEEREALQMEISAYKTHLKKIKGCC